ncbi:MAG: DNA-binding response regulator [Actinobacteria bacterium]|jgi:DNA-binding response OmpR family regulator|nr:DNA-binding response regulator [Actinomycetota bacterium]
MALLVLTNSPGGSVDVLPALGLLRHHVRVVPAEPAALLAAGSYSAVLVDGRRDLAATKSLCRLIRTTGVDAPLFLITTEGGLAAVSAEWGIDDVLLDTAGPAEVDARLRLAIGRSEQEDQAPAEIRGGDIAIDEATYTARVRGETLDLTFREFEFLKFLVQHPGRVFSREQLLHEVWGYDYFGGTRTVDVHVRRLRSKLGPEYENTIITVRNVGYRFDSQSASAQSADVTV